MKTAMQEHIDWLEENQLYFGIPIEAIENAQDLLQKEKEQIMDFFLKGYSIGESDLNPKSEFEKYYNQTYNQNK